MKSKVLMPGILMLAVVFSITSCRKKDPPGPDNGGAKTAAVDVRFSNRVNGADLVLQHEWYLNENGDSFQVNAFRYYISNVRLHGADGTVYAETESYHLLSADEASSLSWRLSEVPSGTYTAISFLIGVDSLRNVSGAQTGALDPVHGMFWDWNTGYIMAKLEGSSPQSANGRLMFHVGGFSGVNNAVKEVTLQFPQPLALQAGGTAAAVAVDADAAEWFRGPNLIDFSSVSTIHMPGANSRKVAENYAGMFSVTSVRGQGE